MAHFLHLYAVFCVSECLVMLYSETQHNSTELPLLICTKVFCKCSRQRYKMWDLRNIFYKTA